MNLTIENFIAAFKGYALQSIIHTKPRTNRESSIEALPFSGSLVIQLLKSNSKDLETNYLPPEEQYFGEGENNDYDDDEEDFVPTDQLPDIGDIDRQIVYYLAGFTTFRKQLNRKLCPCCQEMFFVNKVMRQFCTPLDSQLTQSRDRGGLEYVGTAVHHFFCDLEKIIRHFFRNKEMTSWIHGPARQLKTLFAEHRVNEMFMENEFCNSEGKTCECDWIQLLKKISWYYSQIRINFKCDWLSINLNPRRGRSSDFAMRRLVTLHDLPIAAARES